jgi:hypothetical protein
VSLSFYEVSVESYLRTLRAVQTILHRAQHHASESELNLEDIVRYRLRDDMLPFSFQVISVWHHSMGAVRAMKAGLFEPPPRMTGVTFEKCKALISEAIEELESASDEEINELAGRSMVFRLGGQEMPFTTNGFLTSFSIPNFYFHAATTYDVLRIHGVPLGKMDFLGALKVGA